MMNRQPSGNPGARISARPIRPPRERGTWKAFALAALMHVLLGILLYHGVNWQNNTPAGAEAELWTDIPDLSAPTPRIAPPPAPPVRVQPAPPPAKDEEADIALQEKKRKQEAAARAAQLAEQQRAQQQAEQEAEARRQQLAAQQAAQQATAAAKAAQDKQKQADKQKQLAQQKLDQQKAAQQVKEKQAEADKADQQKEQADAKAKAQADAKAQAEKAQAEAKAKAKAQADAQAKAKLDKERSARLAALQGQAGGGTNSSGDGLAKGGTGSGAGGTATSAGYAEKVQRRVRPNIVWAGETAGLETVVAVRCSPTGTLLSATIRRSSGNEQWDEAALRAVQRSDPMPVDTNGQAPSSFTITLRPAGG